jgi:deoxyribodipyrimidine photo-lyase
MTANCAGVSVVKSEEANREAGLVRWREFLPRAGDYAAVRNYDEPPHAGVSQLSPYLTTRLLLEEEVVSSVLAAYSWPAVEKFVQEVCWRTYWKGWLEQRPAVWQNYAEEVRSLLARWEEDSRYVAAVTGSTGIECFDHWVRELVETGYLHNHARMWFASIWIFTLELPWELGAAFFHRHLLDGDPASNTLSWRWVAGQQTLGKHYVATAENIRKFTRGRFHPAGQLREDASPLAAEKPPEPVLLPSADFAPVDAGEKTGLLLLGCDLCPECSPLAGSAFAGVAGGWPGKVLPDGDPAAGVVDFYRGAFADSLARAVRHFGTEETWLGEDDWLGDLRDWVAQRGLEKIVTLQPTVGPWANLWQQVVQLLGESRCLSIRRPWDQKLWPHATRGFFPFKSKLPAELQQLGCRVR